MGLFIGERGDKKMVEELGLVEKLQTVNKGRQVAHAHYFHGKPVYCTVYAIMGAYKNFLL